MNTPKNYQAEKKQQERSQHNKEAADQNNNFRRSSKILRLSVLELTPEELTLVPQLKKYVDITQERQTNA